MWAQCIASLHLSCTRFSTYYLQRIITCHFPQASCSAGLSPSKQLEKLNFTHGSVENEFRASYEWALERLFTKMWIYGCIKMNLFLKMMREMCNLHGTRYVFVLACYQVNTAWTDFGDLSHDLWSFSAFVQPAAVEIKCRDLQRAVIEFANVTWAKMSQWFNLVIRNVFLWTVLLTFASSDAEFNFD